MLSSNSTTVKKKSETSGEQLRRMCKRIANSISEPQQITDEETGEKREETASDWMEDVYDIRYIVDREKRYMGAELMVAGGGPNIWVNLDTKYVDCLLYTSPSPRDGLLSRMPSSA